MLGRRGGMVAGSNPDKNRLFIMFKNKRTNTSQPGALRASLIRADHRRVIFGKHLKCPRARSTLG